MLGLQIGIQLTSAQPEIPWYAGAVTTNIRSEGEFSDSELRQAIQTLLYTIMEQRKGFQIKCPKCRLVLGHVI
jgi:hypothetical protein